MLDKDTIVKVRNTTSCIVGYTIPELGNLHRNFMPGETKELLFDEIQKLYFASGGKVLLKDHLTIENPDALHEILGNVDPEYFYTKDDVKKLLISGTMDQFMDFLDFAPEGMINTAKDLAVSLKINDIQKREAIKQKTGFDVTNAIQINYETGVEEKKEPKVRRTAPVNQERRTTPPKYKVVETK